MEQPVWRKASYCANGECVEVTWQNGMVVLRNSNESHGRVHFTAEEWKAFVLGVKAGEFDDLD